VVTYQILAIYHKTYNRGPFTKPSLRGRRSLLQELLSYAYTVSNRQRKW